MTANSLDRLLRPRSVAVIGASNDPGRLPGLSLHYLSEAGFAGPIWPVNPNRETVQGIRAYPSIRETPEVPDVAVITTPEALVPGALVECAGFGIGAAVIFAPRIGAPEDPPGTAEHALAVARQAGMRVLGPNCLGLFDSSLGYYGTISLCLSVGYPVPGNVAVVSQSGAYGEQLSHLLTRRGLGVRYLVTTGNEADVDSSEVIAWMAQQDDIDVIAAYAEGVRDAGAFTRALRRAQQAGKRVVFVKVGTSAAGSAAATTHTAALAGDDTFWTLALARHGAYRAESTQEQVDVTYAAARGRLPGGRRLGVLTVSGGLGIQLADAASTNGLEVNALPDELAAQLREVLPFASIGNPLDASGQIVAHLDRLETAIVRLAESGCFDALSVILGSVLLAPEMTRPLLDALLAARQRTPDRLIVVCGIVPDRPRADLEGAGYLVFEDGHAAARAIAALASIAERRRSHVLDSPVRPVTALPAGPVSEHEAKSILAASGVPIWPEILATTAAEAADAAARLGLPVAMKICSAQIPHKSELGGVALDIRDGDEVRRTFDLLRGRAISSGCAAEQLDGVTVAAMAPPGVETILGVKVDPDFGPAVIFGAGGINAEILDDVAQRLAPIDESEAREMIESTRVGALLRGTRGAPGADIDAVARALAALSRFAAAEAAALAEVDLNPFVVWRDGAAALDALIVSRPAG